MFTLLVGLADQASVFNVFRYITFRTGGALITAALFVFMFGPWIINSLRLRQGKGQPIRADGPHRRIFKKAGTPTMGGLMILSGIIVSTLLWANLTKPYVWVVLLVTLGFGLIGFYDDYLKVTKQSHAAFPARLGLLSKFLIAAIAACYVIMRIGRTPFSTSLTFPFSRIWSSISAGSSFPSARSSSSARAMR
jgi:phospho-N-acetylmuramoyl-pentapeptide-transferase